MGGLIKFLAAGALLLPAAPAAVLAGAPTLAEQPVQTVVTGFDPPLERPLIFRRSEEVVRPGLTTASWSLMELVFSRRDGGYRVRVRTLDAGMSGAPPALERAYRNMALRSAIPYVLLLDDQGVLEDLEHEERLWDEMMRLTEEMIREGGLAQGQPANGAAEAFLRMFSDTPRETRLAALTEAVAPIIEYASVEVELGQPVSTQVVSSDIVGTPITFVARILPERVEEGHLFLSVTASVPPEDLARSVENIVGRATSAAESRADAPNAAESAEALRRGRISRETEASFEVNVASGLTRRHRAVARTLVTSAGRESLRTDTTLIERIDPSR